MEQELSMLAMAGATSIVAAMATTAWESARTRTVALFRRHGQDHHSIETQLDGQAALVTQAEDAEGARDLLVSGWQLHLVTLLRQHHDAEDDLRGLVDELRALLPQPELKWVQTVNARDHGAAFGVQGGNINVHYHGTPAPGPESEGSAGSGQSQ